jgi:hypothetical protein
MFCPHFFFPFFNFYFISKIVHVFIYWTFIHFYFRFILTKFCFHKISRLLYVVFKIICFNSLSNLHFLRTDKTARADVFLRPQHFLLHVIFSFHDNFWCDIPIIQMFCHHVFLNKCDFRVLKDVRFCMISKIPLFFYQNFYFKNRTIFRILIYFGRNFGQPVK